MFDFPLQPVLPLHPAHGDSSNDLFLHDNKHHDDGDDGDGGGGHHVAPLRGELPLVGKQPSGRVFHRSSLIMMSRQIMELCVGHCVP